jgi:hypothetical protein
MRLRIIAGTSATAAVVAVSAFANTPLASAGGTGDASAARALQVQHALADAHMANKVASAFGGSYAGAWFDSATAQLHVGVTSDADAQTAARLAAAAGLADEVVATPVRSSWDALVAAQSRWNHRLAKLIASAQASTGLDPAGNDVGIALAVNVPASEREAIEREAASDSVAVSVTGVPSSQLQVKPRAKCKAPFVAGLAYCETTLVSGVGIGLELEKPICTAGPMLIEGNETYMLTSGHCYGKEEVNGEVLIKKTNSAYINAIQKEIGDEVTKWYGAARDMAEVRIARPGSSFIGALPTPLPALVAEWKAKPETPHTVVGVSESTTGLKVCHQGMISGEACGEIKKLNVTFAGKEHLIEVNACGSQGDSGGPYIFRGKGEEVLMVGIETAGPLPECAEPGPYLSYFEPLEVAGAGKEFAILPTFTGQHVLTTLNETRGKGPFFKIKGVLGGKSEIEGKAGKEYVLTAGTIKLKCAKEKLEKASVSDSSGEGTAAFESCTVEGNGTGCEVEGKAFKTELLDASLAFSNKESVKGEGLLISFKPAKGTVWSKVKFVGAKCSVKEAAIEGSAAAEAASGGKAVKFEEEPAEAETNEISFPEKALKTVWVEATPETRTEVKEALKAFGLAATLFGKTEVKLVGGGLWGVATK